MPYEFVRGGLNHDLQARDWLCLVGVLQEVRVWGVDWFLLVAGTFFGTVDCVGFRLRAVYSSGDFNLRWWVRMSRWSFGADFLKSGADFLKTTNRNRFKGKKF